MMTENSGKTAEQWVYAGIREGRGQRYHAWIDPGGEEHYYADKGRFAIGYLYDVKIDRQSSALTRTTPEFTGAIGSDPDQRHAWAALDRAAQTRLAAIARERNASRQDELAELVDPLAELARKLPMPADRDALIAYIIRRVSRVWQ
jgi:hypothetical protein